mgnify:CR=1 FL=1|jgi:hypothetical protein
MISASRRCPVPSSSSMSLVQIIECNNKAFFNLPKEPGFERRELPFQCSTCWKRILHADAAASEQVDRSRQPFVSTRAFSQHERERSLSPARAPP